MMSLLSILLFLAIPAGLVVLIVLAVRSRGQTTNTETGTRGVRRFFQYLLLFALVVVAAIGVSDLLGRLFGADAFDDSLALPLAFALVGVPLACLIAWWTRRTMHQDPGEATSTGYAVYVTLATLTALVVAMVGLQSLLSDALRGDFDGGALAAFLIWGGLWLLHWRLARNLGDIRGWPHLLLGSLIGLGWVAVSMGFLLGASLEALLFNGSEQLVLGTGRQLAEFGAAFTTAALVWVRYWPGAAARLPRTTGWLVYVLPVGVGGGLLTAIVAASILLWDVLVWLIGDTFGTSAQQHFADAPRTLAFALVGVLVWWYHREVLAERRKDRTEVRRVYEYLLSAIALLAVASGITMVIVALIESFTPGLDLGVSVTNTVLGAVTLLAVNVPLWWLFWSRIQRARASDPVSETASPTRRTYLVVLFGIVGVAAVVALLVAVFVFLQDVIEGTASAETLRSMRYALGVLFSAAAVSAYHGAVFREDREVAVVERPLGPRSVLLVGAPAPGLQKTLSRATGARVELRVRADGAAPPWSEERLLAAFSTHPGEDLLVIAGDGLEVVVLQRPSS